VAHGTFLKLFYMHSNGRGRSMREDIARVVADRIGTAPVRPDKKTDPSGHDGAAMRDTCAATAIVDR
jgi:hypothetical protein